MNNIITIEPAEINKKLLSRLEKQSLIRTMRPTRKALSIRKGSGIADIVYSSSPRYGSHKLICVGLRQTSINLNSHSDNEEFIIIDSDGGEKYKPLHIVIGLHKHSKLEDKARRGRLSGRDFLALRFEYNKPLACVFTMLKGTPHCEVTTPKDKGRHPIFFVAEPSRLDMRFINLHSYSLQLNGNHRSRK